MDQLPKYYTRAFNGITDALEALKEQNYGKAGDILIKTQQDAEERYLQEEDLEDEATK